MKRRLFLLSSMTLSWLMLFTLSFTTHAETGTSTKTTKTPSAPKGKVFQPSDHQFSIVFPKLCGTKISKDAEAFTPQNTPEEFIISSYSATQKENGCSVIRFDYNSDFLTGRSDDQILDAAEQGIIRPMSPHLSSELEGREEMTVAGHPARHLLVHLYEHSHSKNAPDKDKEPPLRPYYMRYMIILTSPSQIYHLVVGSPKREDIDRPEVDEFFKSFQLTP